MGGDVNAGIGEGGPAKPEFCNYFVVRMRRGNTTAVME
jgi:hypothetical protein